MEKEGNCYATNLMDKAWKKEHKELRVWEEKASRLISHPDPLIEPMIRSGLANCKARIANLTIFRELVWDHARKLKAEEKAKRE